MKNNYAGIETVNLYPKGFDELEDQDNPAKGNDPCLIIVAKAMVNYRTTCKATVATVVFADGKGSYPTIEKIGEFFSEEQALSFCERVSAREVKEPKPTRDELATELYLYKGKFEREEEQTTILNKVAIEQREEIERLEDLLMTAEEKVEGLEVDKETAHKKPTPGDVVFAKPANAHVDISHDGTYVVTKYVAGSLFHPVDETVDLKAGDVVEGCIVTYLND